MNSFDVTRTVEDRSRAILLPWLEEQGAHYVLSNKGPLAKVFQDHYGDLLFNDRDRERFWTVELKAENRHTGNLFLETWSNKNLDSRRDHAERGSNPGWLIKQRADLLLYHFIDADLLYIISMFKLQQWAFLPGVDEAGRQKKISRLYEFPEVQQRKYAQANDTWGHLVPIETLMRELHVRMFKPVQRDFFDRPLAAA